MKPILQNLWQGDVSFAVHYILCLGRKYNNKQQQTITTNNNKQRKKQKRQKKNFKQQQKTKNKKKTNDYYLIDLWQGPMSVYFVYVYMHLFCSEVIIYTFNCYFIDLCKSDIYL